MRIKIDVLNLSLQTRAGTDAETINTYAEEMKEGATFPPVNVVTDGVYYWLADGFHRVMASKQIGRESIEAIIHEGTEDDAILFGGTANNKQGKRPTRADVRHFMEMVWERRERIFGGTPTGGLFAQKCGIARATGCNFVKSMMPESETPSSRPFPTRVGANGKTYPTPPRKSEKILLSKIDSRKEINVKKDRFGTEIPKEIFDAFCNNDDIVELLSDIRDARSLLRTGFESQVECFKAIRQDALIHLNNAYNYVKAAFPFCVCRMCQGSGCQACHERGWQTEEEYERNPMEFKA